MCVGLWVPEAAPEENEFNSYLLIHLDTFFSVTFIFKEGFNTTFILALMASSTVSRPLYLPSERITWSSQTGPEVYCLISSSCIQRQLHMSDAEVSLSAFSSRG